MPPSQTETGEPLVASYTPILKIEGELDDKLKMLIVLGGDKAALYLVISASTLPEGERLIEAKPRGPKGGQSPAETFLDKVESR